MLWPEGARQTATVMESHTRSEKATVFSSMHTGALSVTLELNNVLDKCIGMKLPFDYCLFWSLIKR